MKIYAPVAFISALLLVACAGSQQGAVATQEHAASTGNVYQCTNGETLAASYPASESAIVRHKGKRYAMRIAVSASGSRYVGDGMEWWTKGSGPGSEGTLLQHRADGTSGDIILRCTKS